MKTSITICCIIVVLLHSCGPGASVSGKKSFHRQYANKLEDAGLRETAMGSMWFAEAENALSKPLSVSLPYRLSGYFAPDKPTAIGLQFHATRGEKLTFTLKKNPATRFAIYADLWAPEAGQSPSLLYSLDTADQVFSHEVKKTGNYILRLQPELLGSGNYELSISVSASLAFPSSSGSIQSFWGSERGGGARKHEGIDIFAPRGTPVLAAADGRVTRVGENRLGGKIIFVRAGAGRNLSLYYAHLEKQLVTEGQRVKKGDTLGLMGNSGNARTTPPHLHFGIYATGGAIDPLPFVNPVTKLPAAVPFPHDQLNQMLRLAADVQTGESATVKKNQVVFVLAAGTNGLLAALPQGERLQVPAKNVQPADKPLHVKKIKNDVPLLAAPVANAPAKEQLRAAASVAVLGYHGEFSLVKAAEKTGWVQEN